MVLLDSEILIFEIFLVSTQAKVKISSMCTFLLNLTPYFTKVRGDFDNVVKTKTNASFYKTVKVYSETSLKCQAIILSFSRILLCLLGEYFFFLIYE